MIRKDYKLGKDAREAIKKVSTQVGDIIGKTLGPAGRNYFLPSGITNDGKTILSEIRFADECEDQIALAFHEVARMTDKEGGDGTTTATVLATQLTLDLIEKIPDIDFSIGTGITVMDLFKKIDEEKNKAIELLKTKVKTVESLEDLQQVAFTSMENKEVADLIAQVMYESGKDALPILDDGFNGTVEKEQVKGLIMPFKIAHTSMFNKVGFAEYENPAIIVVNHSFEQYQELTSFMRSMQEKKVIPKSLVIVAKQFAIPFITECVHVSRMSGLPIILVSGNFDNGTFEDVASYTDATLIDTHPKTGKKISDLTVNHLGSSKRFIARDNEVVFIEGRGLASVILGNESSTIRVGQRISELKTLLEKEKNVTERASIERRISVLAGGIVAIYVDAKTAAEKYYLKLKVQDAVNSCKGALSDGIVKGAGITLTEIANELGESSLIANALREPRRRIVQNNNGNDVGADNVFDSFLVAKAGIENAISVVKVLLTIEGVIAEHPRSIVEELKTIHDN